MRTSKTKLGAVIAMSSLFLTFTLTGHSQTGVVIGNSDRLAIDAMKLAERGDPASLKLAREKFREAYDLFKTENNKPGQIDCLIFIGHISDRLGEPAVAAEAGARAAELARQTGNKQAEARALNNAGKNYTDTGDVAKALAYLQNALELRRQLGDKAGLAATLNNLALASQRRGDLDAALKLFNEAVEMFAAVRNPWGQALVLENIADIYAENGDLDRAGEALHRSLKIHREIKNLEGETTALGYLGLLAFRAGDKAAGLEHHNRALAIARTLGNKILESTVLAQLGRFYYEVGDEPVALKFYTESSDIAKSIGADHPAAIAQVQLGLLRSLGNDHDAALNHFTDALRGFRRTGHIGGVLACLHSIGNIYAAKGDSASAVKYLSEALETSGRLNISAVSIQSSISMGDVFYSAGELDNARAIFLATLNEARKVRDKESEAQLLVRLMRVSYRSGHQRTAIFYGKLSVNLFQNLRSRVKLLERGIQQVYIKSIRPAYRELAEILIINGRLAEAENILTLLKDEEYYDYSSGQFSISPESFKEVMYWPSELITQRRYERLVERATVLDIDIMRLEEDKKKFREVRFPEQARLDNLKQEFTEVDHDILEFFQGYIYAIEEPSQVGFELPRSDHEKILTELNEPSTAIVTTLVSLDRLYLIVTTAGAEPKSYNVETKRADLDGLVLELRRALTNPNYDPRPAGKKLFDLLFPKTMRRHLAEQKIDTLIWSLDGSLRYVPIAALWNGKRYVVEDFVNSTITLSTIRNLQHPSRPKSEWKALAVGASNGAIVTESDGRTSRFEALPAVPEELCGIVRESRPDNCGSRSQRNRSAFPGRILLDDRFDDKAFGRELENRYSVVHVASHFKLDPRNEAGSYLLLGRKPSKLGLATLRSAFKSKFVGVELLTLSACNTHAFAGSRSNGVEIESLGAIAQNLGARSVLASLWAVADSSTKDLMDSFYRNLRKPSMSKSRALQAAQTAMINGQIGSSPKKAARTAERFAEALKSEKMVAFFPDPKKPFEHPFYWSPFVLIGNWR